MRSRVKVESLSDLCWTAEQLNDDLMRAQHFDAAYYTAKLVALLRAKVREEREQDGNN